VALLESEIGPSKKLLADPDVISNPADRGIGSGFFMAEKVPALWEPSG